MIRPEDITIERVLNGKATKDEAAVVAAWLSTDKGQQWLSSRMDKAARDIASGVTPLAADIPADAIYAGIERRIRRRRTRAILLGVAAAILPCILFAAMWADVSGRLGGNLFAKADTVKVKASYGERKQIVFQDGSRVWLNAGSIVSYPQRFSLKERRVTLDGEAYFEVEPNARRPFVIQTADAVMVKVTGTELDVRAFEGEPTVSVVLVNGKAEFLGGSDTFRMRPSQRLVYNKDDGKVTISATESAEMTGLWKDNIISFREATLQEVILTLGRWYDVRFEVPDSSAYSSRFSLRTKEVPLRTLLDEMQHISDLSFIVKDDKVTVSTKRQIK